MTSYCIEIEIKPETAWTEGLMPGERVIEVYTEHIPANDNLDDSNTHGQSSGIVPYEASLRWFPMKKTYMSQVGGAWTSAGASTIAGGVLTASHSSSISNTFTGNLMVTVKDLQGLIGFNTTKTSTATVGYSTNSLPKLKNKGHRLEYRHIREKYKVTQEKKYDRRATKSYGTEYVYPMKWVERQYRVVEFTTQKG